MADQVPPDEVDAEIREAGEELIARYGAEVENATTEKMIQVLDGGAMEEVLHWLKVRQYIRQSTGKGRYERRLSDKILGAVEQAIEQGRNQLARMLSGVYGEVKAEDDRVRGERRK
ncbi:MAG: hypothetical protein QF521_00165 [Alphaproteobacteria bacterium]|jgi:hypothetical protein|nr:hypothetical protein [Alphaproteobacteria bacterium]